MARIIEWESIKNYDEELSKIDHYQAEHHPELLPFIGSHYNEARILLVGESHYCSDSLSEEDKRYILNDWYTLPTPKDFTNKENFNTRYVIENFLSLKRSRAHSMFRNPAKSIINALELKNVSDSEAFNACAFMNYFQRPELIMGGSINNTDEDNKKSFEVFINVCSVIKPDLIMFLSDTAYKEYEKRVERMNVKASGIVEAFPHPTCSHWYSEDGKTKFESVISQYVNFKKFYSYGTYSEGLIRLKMPENYNYIEKRQNRFRKNTITLKTYGNSENVREIVAHTLNNGYRTGVGYVLHNNFVWLWDYDKKEYIDTKDIDNYPGLREMYTDFIKYIEVL